MKEHTHWENRHGKRGNSIGERRTNRRRSSNGGPGSKPKRRSQRFLWIQISPSFPNRYHHHRHRHRHRHRSTYFQEWKLLKRLGFGGEFQKVWEIRVWLNWMVGGVGLSHSCGVVRWGERVWKILLLIVKGGKIAVEEDRQNYFGGTTSDSTYLDYLRLG